MTSTVPTASGRRIIALADQLAEQTDAPPGLTCLYLTPAHRAVAAELHRLMQSAGLDATIDAAGSVIGRLRCPAPDAKTLIVGSHYDTVREAGKYDGRLGILVALIAAEELRRSGRPLAFHLDIAAFSEEEGVRFATPYIGSAALAGRFDPQWLSRHDAEGVAMAQAMRSAGLDPDAIPSLARRRDDLLGYLEVHIEQGPVLLTEDLPVGVVTAIAGAARLRVSVLGEAGHAGTVPFDLRHDAAAAAAELIVFVERRCRASANLLGTVGELAVPKGAVNVIPGRCDLSLDIRAADDEALDAALSDVHAEIARISQRRGVTFETIPLSRTGAVTCAPRLRQALSGAIARADLPVRELMSGAGHDAVMFGGLCDVGMLFVRCGNGGVSHSPRETTTAEDADVAVHVLLNVLEKLEA